MLIGEQEVKRMFKNANKSITKSAIIRLTDDVYNETREGAKPHHQTGWMERNIYKDVRDTQGRVYIQNVPYAIFVHFGTRYYKGDPFMWNGAKKALDKFKRSMKI